MIEIPEDNVVAKLFKIIDDIDTASDFFKPELNNYERYVDRKCREAHDIIYTDGYKLFRAN